MALFESAWGVLSAFIFFLFGMIVVLKIRRYFSMGLNRVMTLYIWHTMWCFIYCWFTFIKGADAVMYYKNALTYNFDFNFGTSAVIFITALLIQGLGLSYVGCFLFFNILGGVGLIAFDASLSKAVEDKSPKLKKLATLIVFLPSVSFWSSAIGKDSIAFMATGLALWSAINLNRSYWLMAFSIIFMLLVRPHIAGIMVLAMGLAVLCDTHASQLKKSLLFSVIVAASSILIPLSINYTAMDTSSLEEIESYVDKRKGYNMDGGGGVDISAMSLPMQVLTYLFRPLFIDADSIFQFAASVDNLIIFYLFVAGGRWLMRGVRSNLGANRLFMWCFAVPALLSLSMTTANLGIAVRQKWMFMPMFIFLFISVIGRRRKNSRMSRQVTMPPRQDRQVAR